MSESNGWSARTGHTERFLDGLSDATREQVNACRTGCPTQDHASYGECLKAMKVGIAAGETSKAKY